MTNKKTLSIWKKISVCITEEISINDEFAKKLSAIISGEDITNKPKKSNRRSLPKIDPFALLAQSVEKLADELKALDLEELKDVIAANGMDTAKLAMKWKDRDRLEKHIIEETQRQSSHGRAFWNATAGKAEED